MTGNPWDDPNFWLGAACGWGSLVAVCVLGFYLYCLYEYLFK